MAEQQAAMDAQIERMRAANEIEIQRMKAAADIQIERIKAANKARSIRKHENNMDIAKDKAAYQAQLAKS
jgi:hypothetical protein